MSEIIFQDLDKERAELRRLMLSSSEDELMQGVVQAQVWLKNFPTGMLVQITKFSLSKMLTR